ncbi:threonine transporter [Rubellimicrobium rubrum]|uniref:Threonine transporter n=1 Tax=Rubellimicrobium rubrum TaxID=2585369 RepID=A0A5C4MMM8_9RHOB|nr:ABC-three component system middle component 2 [Rubellimicrobium rubrum]TNC46259.1 threonine transporter [Rubellimicrobium rubrum]
MASADRRRLKPRIFNTAFESGLRSLILLTACFPVRLGLRRLVVLDYLVVHSGDLDGPESLHPQESSRSAELFVRRGLVDAGLSLMGTRGLVTRLATAEGFRFQAGEEAGTFVDLLRSDYTVALKARADWLTKEVVPLSDGEINDLVRNRLNRWDAEFQSDPGAGK